MENHAASAAGSTSSDWAATGAATANVTEPDLKQLVAEHHAAIYRYAFRLAGSPADAEDLTQQTYLIAQQKLHQMREPEKVRSWLFAVLRSCFLKSCRKQTPTPAAALEMDVNEIPQRTADEQPIDRQQLQAALNELPEEFRVVLVMFYFEDCSYKVIADRLELPIGTVMSRLSRAKGRLRSRLLQLDAAPAAVEHGTGRAADT